MATTSTKQKYLGTQDFINAATGEVVPMQVVQREERDFDFTKVWLKTLIQSFDEIANQKMKLAFWIIENLNKENQLVMTQRQLAKKSGMSLSTVTRTMTVLQECNFLRRLNSGAYIVNPDMLYKGSHNSRMGVVYDYAAAAEPMPKEQVTFDQLERGESDVDTARPHTSGEICQSGGLLQSEGDTA